MRECPLIQDLLPLYLDDALSPESRALADQHLADCDDCRRALTALKTCAPELTGEAAPAPSEDARFLQRLKRRAGSLIGLTLILLAVTAYGANAYGRWQADRAYGRQMELRRQTKQAALEAIRQASPDPIGRLKAAGVELTFAVEQTSGTIDLNYQLSGTPETPVVLPFSDPPANEIYLLDPATGKHLTTPTAGGWSSQPGAPTVGKITLRNVPSTPGRAELRMPYLLAYRKPAQELRWAVERTGEQADQPIGEAFTVAGVEFLLERVRFKGSRVEIEYRQLTDPAKVGFYLPSFRLSDRMGGNWGGDDFPLRWLPDPQRPSRDFELVSSLSKHWTIQVEYAVLVLPGPSIPIDLK